MRRQRVRIVGVLAGILFLLSRLYRVDQLSLFSDEAYAILQAERLRHGASLLGMVKNTTQPVFIWLVSLFQLLPISPIVSSRLASAIAGLLTAWILAVVSSRWINRRSWPIAFVIAMTLPFSFFYDRTVLFESTVGTAISLSLLFPIIGVPLAILVKQTGWLALPLVLLTNRKINIWLGSLFAAFIIPLVVWALAYGSVNGLQSVLTKTSSAPISVRADIKSNFLRSKIWLRTYLTDPIIAIVFLGALLELMTSVKKRTITPLFGVALWTGGVVLFESAIARIFYPRYLYPVVVGVVLLSTRGLWMILKYFLDSILFVPFVLFVLLYSSLRFDLLLMTNPSLAPLALEDRFQFYEDWTSGVGADKIRNYFVDKLESGEEPIVFVEEESSYYVVLKSDPRLRERVSVASWLVDPLPEFPAKLTETGTAYFVRNRNPDIPKSWNVEKVLEIPKSDRRTVTLYRMW